MSILRQILSIIFCTTFFTIFQAYTPVGSVYKKHRTTNDKKKLFQGVNCQYSHDMKIDYKHFAKLHPTQTDFYLSDKKSIDTNSKKYAKEAQSKKAAPMYLKWISDVVGYGVYAEKNLKQGDFIGVYSGKLRPTKPVHDDLDYAWYYSLDGTDGTRLVVDGKAEGNELRFINHVSNPNTMRIDVLGKDNVFYVCYVAKKDIKQDEQLTVSYGDTYWSSRGVKPETFES